MKNAILNLVAVLAVFALALPAAANPQEHRQDERIGQGVASGELTRHEAKNLREQQRHIDRAQRRAKKDGKVTEAEARHVDNMQDRASANIHHQKHDRQDHR